MYISVEATRWTWTESQSERSARLVMLAIAAHCNEDGYAWPSLETLMECSKLSKGIVIEALQKLSELDELVIEKGGRGAGDTNRYYMKSFMDSRVGKGRENPNKGTETVEKGSTRMNTNKNLEEEILEAPSANLILQAVEESQKTGKSADEILRDLRAAQRGTG